MYSARKTQKAREIDPGAKPVFTGPAFALFFARFAPI
jgi:hypothetical protein